MIDDTDRRILSVLLKDARTSLRSIAEEVGVALGTVSNRVKRMEEVGVIQGYGILLDAEKVGWTMTVLWASNRKGRLMEVQRRIAEDPRVLGSMMSPENLTRHSGPGVGSRSIRRPFKDGFVQ